MDNCFENNPSTLNMETEKRIKLIEEAIVIMKDLIVRHDERFDDIRKDKKASDEDFNFKLNALIDSQIRNETEFREVKDSISEVKESIIELRKLSESNIKRIEKIENN